MKITSFLVFGATFLSSCAMTAREVVHVAEASGGAWGAGIKARAAMASLRSVTEVRMSGARAVFQIEEGKSLTKAEVAAAFAAQGMKLESFERIERPLAEVVYEVDSGVTWAGTAAKVRGALLEQTGAIDVYFEKSIQILMADARPLREDAVRKILEEAKVEFTQIQKGAP